LVSRRILEGAWSDFGKSGQGRLILPAGLILKMEAWAAHDIKEGYKYDDG